MCIRDRYYLEGLKQFWKYMAYRAVNGNRTETTADNKNDRAVGRQTGVFKSGKPIACLLYTSWKELKEAESLQTVSEAYSGHAREAARMERALEAIWLSLIHI